MINIKFLVEDHVVDYGVVVVVIIEQSTCRRCLDEIVGICRLGQEVENAIIVKILCRLEYIVDMTS